MPFGIAPASEVFQRKLRQAIEGVDGVYAVTDDILVVREGPTQDSAIADHDRKLQELLERCQVRGIKLNKEKFRLSVSYMGHILSAEGLRPDPQKIKAIREMPTPSSVPEVRRVVGMVNNLSQFLPNLADLCELLRQLTRKNIKWQWTNWTYYGGRPPAQSSEV